MVMVDTSSCRRSNAAMPVLLLCCCVASLVLIVHWKLTTAASASVQYACAEAEQLYRITAEEPVRDAVNISAQLCPEMQQARQLLLNCTASQGDECRQNELLHGVTPLTPGQQHQLWEEGDPLSSVIVHHPTYRLPHPSGKRVGIVFVMFAAYTVDNVSPEAQARMVEQFEGILGAASVFLSARDNKEDTIARQLPVYIMFAGNVSPTIVALALRFDLGVVVVPQSPPLSTCAPPHKVAFEPFRHMLVKTIPYGLEDHFDLLLTMDSDVALTRIPAELFDRMIPAMDGGDMACASTGNSTSQPWQVMPTHASCNAGILVYKPSRAAFGELLNLMRSDRLDCFYGDQRAVQLFLKETANRYTTFELPRTYNTQLYNHGEVKANDVAIHHFVHSTRPESLRRQLPNKAEVRFAREAWHLSKTQQSWGHRQLLMHGLTCLVDTTSARATGS